MSKILTTRQFAVLKRTAQNTYPLLAQKEKKEAKIKELQDELVIIDAQIQGAETGSRALTGGFNSLDLIDRIVIPTGKMDKDGRELKMTKFVEKEGAVVRTTDKDGHEVYEILLSIPAESVENEETAPAEKEAIESVEERNEAEE